MNRLLEIKAEMKRRKPRFRRQNTGLKARLAEGWRKAQGVQAKLRLGKKSRGAVVSPGYRTPKQARGLTNEGLIPVRISTPAHLPLLKPKEHALIIDSSVGMKRRIELIQAGLASGFKLLNFRDAQKELERLKREFENRVEEKKRKASQKKEKKAESKSIEQKVEKSEEEKKQEERLEKEKVLTKPN